jgi:hypothetical protein
MASSSREPLGYRRTDPDETEGRLLYRRLAEREARMSVAMGRKVSLSQPPPQELGEGGS